MEEIRDCVIALSGSPTRLTVSALCEPVAPFAEQKALVEVPASMATAIARAMSHKAEDRYPSVLAFVEARERRLLRQPSRQSPYPRQQSVQSPTQVRASELSCRSRRFLKGRQIEGIPIRIGSQIKESPFDAEMPLGETIVHIDDGEYR